MRCSTRSRGELADRIGRKGTVLIAGAMFTLGALVRTFAPDTVILVAGRPARPRCRVWYCSCGACGLESPRWLMKMGRRSEAAVQLQKIRPGVDLFIAIAGDLIAAGATGMRHLRRGVNPAAIA